jgi:hypothetical protein
VLKAAAPGHVEQVRRSLFDALTPEQVRQLSAISTAILTGTGPITAEDELAAGDDPAGDDPVGDDEPAAAREPV